MSNFPKYDTKLFSEVFDDVGTFLYYYFNRDTDGQGIPTTISESSARTLYYLLYAKYGNNPIANYDENQFRYKLFSIVFQFGPTWEKRLAIQLQLRNLTIDDLREGTEAVHNHANNPSTSPAVDAYEALNYINDQNATKYKKSKLDAYGQLWDMLNTDVTGEFLAKFQKLFKQFVKPECTWIYQTPCDCGIYPWPEEEEEDDE